MNNRKNANASSDVSSSTRQSAGANANSAGNRTDMSSGRSQEKNINQNRNVTGAGETSRSAKTVKNDI